MNAIIVTSAILLYCVTKSNINAIFVRLNLRAQTLFDEDSRQVRELAEKTTDN